jgi:hypothetical protein
MQRVRATQWIEDKRLHNYNRRVTSFTVPAQASCPNPLDTAVAAHDAGDVSADALVEHRLPGHEAKLEPVVDHGVAPTGEIGRPDERAAEMLARLGRLEGPAARFRNLLLGARRRTSYRLRPILHYTA